MELVLKAAFERDVDMVLARAFYEQNGAAQLFLKNGDKILHVQHSAMELHGESDLQIIVQRNGSRHAILIEDKVDAPAQPDQYQRSGKDQSFAKSVVHGQVSFLQNTFRGGIAFSEIYATILG